MITPMINMLHTIMILSEYFKSQYTYFFPKELIQFISELYYKLFRVKIIIGKSASMLLNDRKVYTWGDREFNFLGHNGRYSEKIYSPQKIDLDNIKKINSAKGYFMVIDTHGQIYSWGINEFGRLGFSGDNASSNRPQKIHLENVEKIYCNEYYSMAVNTSNDVYSWGKNSNYNLALGYKSSRVCLPVKSSLVNIKKISCIGTRLLVLTTSHEAYYRDINIDNLQKLNIPNVKQISGGVGHSMVLTHCGHVYISGENKYGELGLGHSNNVDLPEKMDLSNIKKIYCYDGVYSAITFTNEVYIWGSTGIISHKSDIWSQKESRDSFLVNKSPMKLSLTNVKEVSFGIRHIAILTNLGQVYMCGCNKFGQIGIGNAVRKAEMLHKLDLPPIKKIYCEKNYSYAVTYYNEIYVWGKNKHGVLGVGHSDNVYVPTKIIID